MTNMKQMFVLFKSFKSICLYYYKHDCLHDSCIVLHIRLGDRTVYFSHFSCTTRRFLRMRNNDFRHVRYPAQSEVERRGGNMHEVRDVVTFLFFTITYDNRTLL